MDVKKIGKDVGVPLLVIVGLFFLAIGLKDVYMGFFNKGSESGEVQVKQALSKSKEFVEYTDETTGLTLQYPKEWTKGAVQGGMEFKTLDGVVNVRTAVDDLSKEKERITPEKYRELMKKQLGAFEEKAQMKYTTITEGTTTIQNLPAYQWTYTLKVRELLIGGAQAWLVKDGKVFVLTYTTPSQLFDSFYPTFQHMVQSVRLNEKK